MRDYNSTFNHLKNRRIWFDIEKFNYSNERIIEYYDGIFSISIDRKVSFTFVPNYTLLSFSDIQEKFNDAETVRSKNEARIYTLLSSDYIITPSDNKKGTTEKLSFGFSEYPYPFNGEIDENITVIYYTSSEEFSKFSNEFYHEYIDDEEQYDVTIANMIKFNYVKFIIKNIITSDYFTDRDYQWLLSGNK
jgi:hypothetical protein